MGHTTIDIPPTVDALVGELDRVGYVVLPGHLPVEEAAAVRRALTPLVDEAPWGENSFVGRRTKRRHSIFGHTRAADDLAIDPTVLAVADAVLGDVLLSASVGVEIHPGEVAQTPHYDDGLYPLPLDHDEVWLGALWALDDFTTDNGATVVHPGSQGDRTPRDLGESTIVEMPAGSVMLYKGTLWHGGGANTSDRPRLGLVLSYVCSWLRPQDANLISVPLEVARGLPSRLRDLLGYAMRPPFHGYVDGRDPRMLFDDTAGSG